MEQKLFTKNFTLLVLGQASSLFGNYILRLALSMYVLEVTGSAAVFAGDFIYCDDSDDPFVPHWRNPG